MPLCHVDRSCQRCTQIRQLPPITSAPSSATPPATWGDVDAEDWRENDRSLAEGARLLSAYRLPDPLRAAIGAPSDRLWTITEADRSVTTLLWPSEY